MISKILVVDDDPRNVKIVTAYLKGLARDILYARDGKTAFDVAYKESPNIIIMDWAMPVMNGLETTLKMKATDETKDIPIILASGMMTDPKDLKKALEAGATDYIRKPFDVTELTARVNSALRISESYREIKRKNTEIAALYEKEKAFHERELTMHSVYENKKNQMLTALSLKLQKLEEKANEETKKDLKSIRKEIQFNLSEEKAWENFMVHFEKVHPDFIKTLKQQFHELTPNDLRIASYIKMGMDNKEIARTSGVKVESIKININRLKKRLNLHAEESIRDFILSV